MDAVTISALVAIVIYVVVIVLVLLLLSAIIRNAVRRGIEDVLYKKGKDGLWSANPWVVAIAKEIAAETRKTDS
jgi:hypothetical protein